MLATLLLFYIQVYDNLEGLKEQSGLAWALLTLELNVSDQHVYIFIQPGWRWRAGGVKAESAFSCPQTLSPCPPSLEKAWIPMGFVVASLRGRRGTRTVLTLSPQASYILYQRLQASQRIK